MHPRHILFATAALTAALPAAADIVFAGNLSVPGETADLSGFSGVDARGSYGSDLFYDKARDEYYGITDRGAGGGLIPYAPRVNVFKLAVGGNGAVSNFQQQRTVVFKGPNGQPLTGLFPNLIPGGNAATLGAAFDSEGFARRANGNYIVADEYGPSVYEFKANGDYVRAFTTPANLAPRLANGTIDYVAGRNNPPTVGTTAGRQDNRGFEGITLSHDGKTAYAILQDPLVAEGPNGQGRRGVNTRIVAFDVATGVSTGQFVYQLEDRAAINGRILAENPAGLPFDNNSQGRSIGVSAIYALKDGKFLVLERDNRGVGTVDPTGTGDTIGSKRVYLIDLNGATNIGETPLVNGALGGAVPVSKTLFLDVNAALKAAGVPVAEKIEGLTLGPDINGGISLILATDNDFSVTQTGAGAQLDICTSGLGAGATSSQIPFGSGCPAGQKLLPTYFYSFALTGADRAAVAVPEPATWALMLGGFGVVGAALRRRKAVAA